MWLNLSINDQNGGKPNGLVNVGELSKFIEKPPCLRASLGPKAHSTV